MSKGPVFMVWELFFLVPYHVSGIQLTYKMK